MTQALYAHMNKKKKKFSIHRVLVAHTSNPSYSEGRDQEDQSQFQASPISKKKKKKNQNKGLV
jgi:hypothetical protein